MNIDKITKQYNKALEIKKGDKYAETHYCPKKLPHRFS